MLTRIEGEKGPALGITSYPTQGTTYKLTVTARSSYGAIGTASLVRTVNYLPYGGSCTLDTSSGKYELIQGLNCYQIKSWHSDLRT